ncbi:MAG: sigma-70 family polymerase sigma factor [Chloroflexi bacterium]|nr:sigma-70 family polymerase sigma factor [Chloroflexota bacterium]
MQPASVSDQALMERVVSRDPSALDVLYERYARAVYSLVYRILGDGSAAEDVVQEVFLKLWKQPESYNAERGALGSWLLSVAHNRAIDQLRRRKSREEHPLPELRESEELVADGALDPADLAGLNEAAAAIRRALAQIPPAQRRAIEMAFFEGKTHVEIAAELDEPLGTAKTRIRLGMRKLRSILEAEGVVTQTA